MATDRHQQAAGCMKPVGKALPSKTWHTMMRGHLLLSAPGVADVAASAVCGRMRVGGTACGHTLSSRAHEYTFPVSGLQNACHTRVRKWLAERLEELCACKVDDDVAVTQPLVRRDGRMDVIATRYGVKLLVDVVVLALGSRARETQEAFLVHAELPELLLDLRSDG